MRDNFIGPKDIGHKKLLSVMEYNPVTGDFKWKLNKARKVKEGSSVGSINGDGFVITKIDGKQYLVHRLAWFYVNKKWPKRCLIHINKNKSDNRISNLCEYVYTKEKPKEVKERLNQGHVLRALNYDKETGVFTWKKNKNRRSRLDDGAIAGSLKKYGYIKIKLRGKQYSAARLAWLYVYGSWPSNYIDHINGVKTDNRICNLRDATPRQNSQNLKRHREGKLIGANFVKKTGKYKAVIKLGKSVKYLGIFKTEIEAHQRYMLESSKADQMLKKMNINKGE